MRHLVKDSKLGRGTAHRKATFRTLADSLIMHGRIQTTVNMAKQLRSFADRLVTLGKDGSLAARRRAITMLRTDEALHKLFSEVAAHFKNRAGGYTRVLRLGTRRVGDNAERALIEYVDLPVLPRGKKAKAARAETSEKGKKPKKEAKPAKASTEKATAKKKA